MNRTISIILVVVGVTLVAYGVSAAQSLGSDISRFFTGQPTDRAIWLLLGGVVSTIIGLAGLGRGRP